jgi:hypothetical protein
LCSGHVNSFSYLLWHAWRFICFEGRAQKLGCRDEGRERIRSPAGCVAPRERCACNVCRRQPPSLRDLAQRTFHYHMFNVHKLQLTREVTYREYVFAYGFNLEDSLRLLSPQYAHIAVDSWFASSEMYKLHRNCIESKDGNTSRIRIDHEFRDAGDAVLALIHGRKRCFCCRCEKPLLFKETCPSHETQ